ncbi:hypothetical protein HK097_007357, partial [Rhizophlyctis rosea]
EEQPALVVIDAVTDSVNPTASPHPPPAATIEAVDPDQFAPDEEPTTRKEE